MGLFHEVRGWLQLHHHFRPWAHVISVRALLTHISSNRPQGAIYHTQDNQMQHFSARTLTPPKCLPNPSVFLSTKAEGNGIGTGYICFTPSGQFPYIKGTLG